jgi:uncharacterized membrane protein YhaH (DUF805 family)
MEFWIVFLAAYATVVAFAFVMTFRERRGRAGALPFHIVMGYVLCALWPAVVMVMVIVSRPGGFQRG